MPFQELPAKLIQDLRALDFVYNVPYSGYEFASVDEFEQFKGKDEEGNEVDLVALEDIRAIGLNMTIYMKGGNVDIDALEGEEAE
jgi:hypothetical protein